MISLTQEIITIGALQLMSHENMEICTHGSKVKYVQIFVPNLDNDFSVERGFGFDTEKIIRYLPGNFVN